MDVAGINEQKSLRYQLFRERCFSMCTVSKPQDRKMHEMYEMYEIDQHLACMGNYNGSKDA